MIPAAPTGGGFTGTITATITLGGGAEGWRVTKSGDMTNAFITDFTSSGGRGNSTLTITYTPSNMDMPRTATLTVETVGGTGNAITEDLVLTQMGASFTFTTNPANLPRLPATRGTFTIDVMPGGGATGWTAAVTEGSTFYGGFVSIDKEAPGGSVGTENRITVTYEANNVGGTNFRDGEITLTSVGGSGDAFTHVISFTQLPDRETVRVRSSSGEGLDVLLPRSGGTLVADLHGSWTVNISDVSYFLRIISTTDEQVVMEYLPNGEGFRDGYLSFTHPDISGISFTITQSGAEPVYTITTDPPDLRRLPAEGGEFTLVLTIANDVESWSFFGLSFLDVEDAPPGSTSPAIITFTYGENTGTAPREGA